MDKILKIAQKLKIFTLDDLIIMDDLDEDFATKILNQLIIEGKIKLTGKYFEYIETQTIKDNYTIIDQNIKVKNSEITMPEAVEMFLNNIKPKVTHRTFLTYKSQFNSHIIPFFKSKELKDIIVNDVDEFKDEIASKKLRPRKIKNTLVLLNQIIKYFQNKGYIGQTCIFEVKRLKKEPMRKIQILTKNQVGQLFLVLKNDYKYLFPIVKRVIKEKIKLAEVLQADRLYYAKYRITPRKIRTDFFKIKQRLNLEDFKFDDLRLSNM